MMKAAIATAAGAFLIGGALAGAATAAAAPTGGTSAQETIARLQADGNRVIVNKVGSGSDCSVSSVRRVTVPQLPQANPFTGMPIIQQQAVVHVGLKC